MSSSFEQIREATRKKSNGLFFIKSKHVPPTFHNHWYFQMNQPKNTKTQQSQYLGPQNLTGNHVEGLKKWKMFVDQPKSYGIENTFRYMCDRIRQNNKRNMVQLKKIQSKLQKNIRTDNTPTKQLLTISSQKYNSRKDNHTKQQIRIKTQPNNKYLQTTQSFNYRIRKSRCQHQQQPHRKNTQTKMTKTANECSAQHFVEMIYIGGRNSYYNELSLQNKIAFNLLPYILSCFFKCKINYSKKLSQYQYNRIISSIEEIKLSTKSYFDVKDIINLSNVQEVLQILDIYGQGSLEWIETVRYFFMPNDDILHYQLNKMQDQIKVMSILKFNAELNQENIYIYRVQDKVKIQNIYDMLKPGTYIYSENKAVYEIYCSILKKKAELFSYKNRIQRWRSIAPLDQTDSNKKSLSASDRGSSQALAKAQKYKKLYQMTQKRRKRNQRANIATNLNVSYSSNNGILITHGSGNNSFIDKSKLHRVEDIFE